MTYYNRLNRIPSPLLSGLDQFFQRALTNPAAASRRPHGFAVAESESAWTLRRELPGFDKKDVSLSVERDLLKVTATASEDNPGFASGFEQALRLPNEVDRTGISASLNNGVLEITLPRLQEQAEQEIRIEVN